MKKGKGEVMIISPWVFYLIDALNNMCTIAFIGALIIPFILLVCCFCVLFDCDDDEKKQVSKYSKIMIRALVLCILVLVLVPGRETCYKMLISNYVTTDNIDKATEIIQDGVDYIFDKLDEE